MHMLSNAPHSPTIVIATAMEVEAKPFLEAMQVKETLEIANQVFYHGSWMGQEILLVQTGIGLVNGAAAATRAHLLLDSQVRAYICAGTCGGLAQQVNVRDVIVGTSFVYSRADATAFGYEPGQVPGMPAVYHADTSLIEALRLPTEENIVKSGAMASSDAFVTANNVEDTRERFPQVLGVDMESTAAAQVCHLASVPFISVRGVSDLCGPAAGQDFHIGADEAAQASFMAVERLVAGI